MDNHHILLIFGHGPALVVQSALQCLYLLFVVSNIVKVKVDIKKDITRVIFQLYVFPSRQSLVYDYSLSRGIIVHN